LFQKKLFWKISDRGDLKVNIEMYNEGIGVQEANSFLISLLLSKRPMNFDIGSVYGNLISSHSGLVEIRYEKLAINN